VAQKGLFIIIIIFPVEAGSNTSTVALRVVGGDGKGTRCLGAELGHHITGGHKYRDLVRHVGGWTQGYDFAV
jgi:hypothetical protein